MEGRGSGRCKEPVLRSIPALAGQTGGHAHQSHDRRRTTRKSRLRPARSQGNMQKPTYQVPRLSQLFAALALHLMQSRRTLALPPPSRTATEVDHQEQVPPTGCVCPRVNACRLRVANKTFAHTPSRCAGAEGRGGGQSAGMAS